MQSKLSYGSIVIIKAKEGITEDEKLIQMWKTEGDPCISCIGMFFRMYNWIAAFALEQQERDEEAASKAALASANGDASKSTTELTTSSNSNSNTTSEPEKKAEVEAPQAGNIFTRKIGLQGRPNCSGAYG